MTLRGGKIDWNLARLFHIQEDTMLGRGTSGKNRHPKFDVYQKITYYDGTLEVYLYENCTFFNYNIDVSSNLDEVTESFKAICPSRKCIEADNLINQYSQQENSIYEVINDSIKNLKLEPQPLENKKTHKPVIHENYLA